jgi:hypothetical protein
MSPAAAIQSTGASSALPAAKGLIKGSKG